MRRLALLLACLATAGNSGCRLANHSPKPSIGCGEACVTSAACSTACGSSSCSTGQTRACRRDGFGLFGKLFCDSRLSEGTACLPWQYSYNLCLATSQLSNTILGGDPDESLSSRFGRAQEDGVFPVRYGVVPVTNLIVGSDHCHRCIEYDEPREKELWAW